MGSKIIFIADFYYPNLVGGAELNDFSLIRRMESERGDSIVKVTCTDVDLSFVRDNQNEKFIISNFVNLQETVKEYISENCTYIIYEHDHKYLKKRNPIFYKNFLAPREDLANLNFYKNAKTVVCLTKLAEDVLRKNTGLENVTRIGSSVWTDEDLDFITSIRKSEKKDCYAIMDSDNPIKKRSNCISYCNKNDLQFELIRDSNHQNFLNKLSKYRGLIFMTGHLETCCRIVLEAKMLGLQVITQKKLIGAASEESFHLDGEDLVNEIRNVSKNSINLFYVDEQ
jgi:hypothetical protein